MEDDKSIFVKSSIAGNGDDVSSETILNSDWDQPSADRSYDSNGHEEDDIEEKTTISTWRKKFGSQQNIDNDSVLKRSMAISHRSADNESINEIDETEVHEDINDDTAEGEASSRVISTGIDDLPLFADAKNRRLHKRIRNKEKKFNEVCAELTETSSRVEIMSEHLKNVKQEIIHTQELFSAKQNQLMSEQHMKKLADREIGRLTQESRRLDAECNDFDLKLNTVQISLFKGNEAMDAFKVTMNWNQDEMEQWKLTAKQKDEDSIALDKYRRADETMIKELSLEIAKLTKSFQNQKRLVDDENTETQAKQIELERISKELHQLHEERQQLIKQWQDTIDVIKRRDQDIADSSVQYAQIFHDVEEKKKVLLEVKQRLKLQERENSDIQATISVKERQQSKTNLDLQQAISRLQEFQDQVDVVKNQVANAVTKLSQQRSQNANKVELAEVMQKELGQAQMRYNVAKKALETWADSTMDAETLAKRAQEDVMHMENGVKRLEKEIIAQKEVIFRKSQQLFSLRQKQKTLTAEIAGCKASSENLTSKLKSLDQQVLRQQELVYNGEFQIQQMERKVARASGERSAEETKLLRTRIEFLEKDLECLKAEETLLIAQCKKLEDERRGQERVKKSILKEKEEIQAIMHRTELSNESCLNLLKQTLKMKEDLLVQHDLQSLEVRRLRDIMNRSTHEVFSLESRDYQLKKNMEERKKEIILRRNIQRLESKNIEDERHKLFLEVGERENRVKRLQAKFEVLCNAAQYGDGADEGNVERTQASLLIRAAQRREDLQAQGDDLDNKIRIVEKDIRGLKKTLQHLESQNSDYRRSFHRVDIMAEDQEKLRSLETQLKYHQDRLYEKKKIHVRTELEFENETNRLKELESRRAFITENCSHLNAAHKQLSNELDKERAKLVRTVTKLEKLLSGHSKDRHGGTGADSAVAKEQILLEMYNHKEIMTSLLYTLGQLAEEFPEIKDLLQRQVYEFGLHIPKIPPGRTANARFGNSRKNKDPASDDGTAAIRPLSARSNQSNLSSRSTGSNSSRSSAKSQYRHAAPMNTVQIGF